MPTPPPEDLTRDVSPLELFFDLVFVLAVGQLTHHLLTHLSWHGAAQMLVMLVAVCGVWAFTSFELTLLDIERSTTRFAALVVMGLGLFMNAGISQAFDNGGWLFVVPLLLALVVPGAYAATTAPSPTLRGHFRRVLVWWSFSTPFWVVGAALEPKERLWCWAVAAALDLIGTFSMHPLPGRRTGTEQLPFDAEHMLERLSLFLIILLGETVLALGRAIAAAPTHALTLLAAVGGFVALATLWFLYFGRAEEAVVEHAVETADPIRTVHLGINVIYGIVVGLVVFAAGAELVITGPVESRAGVGGVLLLAGPAAYVAAQAVYFARAIGRDWQPRVVGVLVLLGAAAAAYWVPPLVAVGLLVVVLGALAWRLGH